MFAAARKWARVFSAPDGMRTALLALRCRFSPAEDLFLRIDEDADSGSEPLPTWRPGAPEPRDSIPRRVFQTWKSKTDVPAQFRHWRATFIRHNPEFDVFAWDDDDNRSFIESYFPWFLELYDGYPKEIFRADAVRLFFLFQCGGLYADMDVECLGPLDRTLARGDVILGGMGSNPSFEHGVPNAIMASKPFQLFWVVAIALLVERAATQDRLEADRLIPEFMTGPILLKNAADEFLHSTEAELWARAQPVLDKLSPEVRALVRCGRLEVLRSVDWYPFDWTNPSHQELRQTLHKRRVTLSPAASRWLFPRSTLVTYWSHSWEGGAAPSA